jgi:hypothetical protein
MSPNKSLQRIKAWGTSYIAPVKREIQNILFFVKTVSYKTVLILGTLFPLNPNTDSLLS